MFMRMWRKRNTFALLVVMQTGAATLENCMEVPQKIENRATLWQGNCTTRHLSMGYRYAVSKGHMRPMFMAALSTIAKVWKEPKCPTMDECIKKMWYRYKWSITWQSKRMKSCHLQLRMELEGIMLSEISQSKTKIIWPHSWEDFKRQNRST